ncbi:MAG: class I SAM-dependent methyltransferase [Lachnospiraceae bacterium]|nr:class I SAM-dependent methyltransferase [Lachnospiraceae bacterium]
MEAYTGFAQVYDTFMDNTPYKEWAERIRTILAKEGIKEGLVLDLGCGTGSLTTILSDLGYDMIGVDLSPEMLQIAQDKRKGRDILYLCQDMREFELYGTVRAVVSVCDSVNYLTEDGDLTECFRLVNNYLDPSGLFIFDFNTLYKYRDVIGETTIAENREEASFIWENYFDEEEQLNEYELTIFAKEGNGLYRKFEEVHLQRGYTLSQMKEALKSAGMEFVDAFDSDTLKEPTDESERILVIAKEKGKG